MLTYQNLAPEIGLVVTAQLATLHELDTVYGIEDLENLVEIALVNAHNRRKLEAPRE